MCGRYADELSDADFEYLFGFTPKPEHEWLARFNLSPGQDVRAVRVEEQGAEFALLR